MSETTTPSSKQAYGLTKPLLGPSFKKSSLPGFSESSDQQERKRSDSKNSIGDRRDIKINLNIHQNFYYNSSGRRERKMSNGSETSLAGKKPSSVKNAYTVKGVKPKKKKEI